MKVIEKNEIYRDLKIDVDGLTTMQSRICFKYETPVDVSVRVSGMEKVASRLDHYFLHAIEEVIETRQEVGNVSGKLGADAVAKELIDVILYLCTIRSIFLFNLNELLPSVPVPVQKTVGFPKGSLEFRAALEEEGSGLGWMDGILFNVVSGIVKIRQMFPERKWHKPHGEHDNSSYFTRFMSATATLDYLLSDCFATLMEVWPSDKIDKEISRKSKFILDL